MSDSLLITGATGTFGRAFLRASLLSGQWRRVICYSRDELKHAALWAEFGQQPALRLFLGDVRDEARLAIALRGVEAVVHAAALKRVDQSAYSPSEVIATNVLGTMNVINAAIHAGVQRVVVISSDKAVAATNIYGATKFCSEIYAVQANAYGHSGGTKIAAVRYGNVLGSRGSVVHVWRDQLAKGEPLAVTDPEMTRFIMTIEDAVTLVNHALGAMAGGEVFVPVLPSATMLSLASAVAGGSFEFRLVGLRPGGEKMAESLLSEEEPRRTRRMGEYLVVLPAYHEWTTGEEWTGGVPVPPEFVYRSDRNDQWLTPDQLRQLLCHTEALR